MCACSIEPVRQGGGDVPRQPGRERGADVEHPRWPEMWQSLIRHVRGLRFPASDHRLDETITAAQRVKHNAAKCTKKHDVFASAKHLRVTPWPRSTQDAAEALYDYVVQKDSLGPGGQEDGDAGLRRHTRVFA